MPVKKHGYTSVAMKIGSAADLKLLQLTLSYRLSENLTQSETVSVARWLIVDEQSVLEAKAHLYAMRQRQPDGRLGNGGDRRSGPAQDETNSD